MDTIVKEPNKATESKRPSKPERSEALSCNHRPLSRRETDLENIRFARLEKELLETMISHARTDFYTFVRLMAPNILPEDFVDGRHIHLVCSELQRVEESVRDKSKIPVKLQLFMPPGSMKSRLASNLFPAWCLGRNPNWCFLAIGSDFDFSVDNFGRPTKDIIDSEQYQTIFPDTILRKDVNSAGRWDTTKKGRFVARGVGQNIAGRRSHISIVDDAITEQTTDTERKSINRWYIKGLRTRLLPRGAEIIINTRWFVEDLSGYLIKREGQIPDESPNDWGDWTRPWRVVSLPALLTKEASLYMRKDLDPSDPRFKEGTSFWPEFWPTELLIEKRETMDVSEWLALYMQTPTSEDGTIIKRAYFNYWDEQDPPDCKYVVVSMDTAFSTSESADYSAYTVWGVFQKEHETFDGGTVKLDNLILLSAKRGKWDFAELCDKAQGVDGEYNPDFFIVENKASGQSLIVEMRKRGLPIMEYRPDKDKTYRLQATTPYFKANRIWMPKNKRWAEEVVEELLAFNPRPNGSNSAPHDDYVDTTSQAILWMRDRFMLDNDGYSNKKYNNEDEFFYRNGRKGNTYWSSLF